MALLSFVLLLVRRRECGSENSVCLRTLQGAVYGCLCQMCCQNVWSLAGVYLLLPSTILLCLPAYILMGSEVPCQCLYNLASIWNVRQDFERFLHNISNTRKVSSTTCPSGAIGTYSSTECSLTTPVDIVIALTLGRKPLVSLPMKVGCICTSAPRWARTAR